MRYIVYNASFGNVCFNGKRFWTVKGATRYAQRNIPLFARAFTYEVRQILG